MDADSTEAADGRIWPTYLTRRLGDCVGPVLLLVTAMALMAMRWRAEPDGQAAAAISALFDAARAGNIPEMERAFTSGMAVDSVESGSRMTPLCCAVRRNHPAAVEWLLERGANIESVAGSYGRPLGIAAEREDGAEMVRLLLERGADPSGCSADGRT